jgi:exopolyphosphatase/guanosine-5'-triphosphate,3'-diphosphate pyrophosphatase
MAAGATAAAVDIGTNSVKLTVGRRRDDGSLDVLLDTTTVTRLGKGVDAAGRLDDEAVHRTLTALASFGQEARNLHATRIAAVGTSALRDAANGAEFVRQATLDLGGTVEVISGDREAELIYWAGRRDPDLALPSDENVTVATMDIGGGSTEFVLGRGETILFRDSLQLGAVRLTERALPSDPPTPEELARAAALADEALSVVPVPDGPAVIVGSGGTIANLVAMELRERPDAPAKITADLLHATRLTLAQIENRIARLSAVPLAERRSTPGLEPDRADVIVAGAIIQARSLRRLGATEVLASARGLRYGLLYELLDGAADV